MEQKHRMNISKFLLVLLTTSGFSIPLSDFVKEGMKNNLLVKEKQFEAKVSEHDLEKANREAILPRLRVSLAYGPAPGVNEKIDTSYVNGTPFYERYEEFNFTKLGSYFGMSAEFTQPLNFGRLNLANKALKAGHKVKLAEIKKTEYKYSTDLQMLYYGYQLAKATNKLATKVRTQIIDALDDMEEKLDEEDESVSQLDFLELKSGLFEIEDGLYETEEGLKRAKANIEFLFTEQKPEEVIGADTNLVKHPAKIPSFETLDSLLITHHPDLKQLKFGLIGLENKMHLEYSDLGPGFFIFGKFEFAKSWARDRLSQDKDAFAQDPLNKIEGAIGIGAQFNLNFWNTHHKAVESKLEYKSLQLKGDYAEEGLRLKLKERYFKVIRNLNRLKSVNKSLKASSAWVKGAAMQYDLDKSQQGKLLSAYRKNIGLEKDYLFTLYDYNHSVAELIEACGLTLEEFLTL
jgi:outer membrane protein TolC